MASTTLGSANVLRSPNWSPSPEEILRMIRRMILPDRVLGRSGTMKIFFGAANGPMTFLTWRMSSFVREPTSLGS